MFVRNSLLFFMPTKNFIVLIFPFKLIFYKHSCLRHKTGCEFVGLLQFRSLKRIFQDFNFAAAVKSSLWVREGPSVQWGDGAAHFVK